MGPAAGKQSGARREVPVVAGFQGLGPEGRVTTLGRGGSDTSAVALAAALKAAGLPEIVGPDGLIRPGLNLQVSYEEVNQGIAAVRNTHENRVLLARTPQAAFGDPNAEICDVDITGPVGLPLLAGTSLSLTYGLGSGTFGELCRIPFRFPPGDYDLYVEVDSGANVPEKDPNGDPAPAEGARGCASRPCGSTEATWR